MAVLTPAAFKAKYDGLFTDNINGEISEADMREFVLDLKDSFASVSDLGSKYDASNPNGFITASRLNPRVSKMTTVAALTFNPALHDCTDIEAQNSALNIGDPTTLASDFTRHIIRIKDDGIARPISWGPKFSPFGIALPNTTVPGLLMRIELEYNEGKDEWFCISVNQE